MKVQVKICKNRYLKFHKENAEEGMTKPTQEALSGIQDFVDSLKVLRFLHDPNTATTYSRQRVLNL